MKREKAYRKKRRGPKMKDKNKLKYVSLIRFDSLLITWLHLYSVFSYIYSLSVDEDLCESRNVSIKFSCALFVCVFHLERSSFFVGIPFSITIFVLSVFRYFHFYVVTLYLFQHSLFHRLY